MLLLKEQKNNYVTVRLVGQTMLFVNNSQLNIVNGQCKHAWNLAKTLFGLINERVAVKRRQFSPSFYDRHSSVSAAKTTNKILDPDWHLLCKLHEIWSVDSQENHSDCCHQMSHFKAEMHQIRFRLGLYPRPCWGSLQHCPYTLARFKWIY